MTIDPKSTIGGRMSQAARRTSQAVVVDVEIPLQQITLRYTTGVPDDETILMTAKLRALKAARHNLGLIKAKIIDREG